MKIKKKIMNENEKKKIKKIQSFLFYSLSRLIIYLAKFKDK